MLARAGWAGLIAAAFFLLPGAARAGDPECPLQKEIGQLFVVAIPQMARLEDFQRYSREKNIGGVMLFGWNLDDIHSPNGLIALTNAIQEGRDPGLFIAADQEGGLIQRLNKSHGFTTIPSARRVGAAGDRHLAYQVGRMTGQELKAVGVNWNFAPSVDVATNPNNPAVAMLNRSYSSDPQEVGALASEVVRGMAGEGLITTAKHFPGHGDTGGDSHAGGVRISKPWEEIVKTELVPFVEAINHGVLSVMVGHINVPCVDEPASLSPELLQGLLREKMKFGGLIVTDDLAMGAISQRYDAGTAAVKAVLAGNDILLANFGSERPMMEKLCSASQLPGPAGDALRARIRESYARVLAVKQKMGIEHPRLLPGLKTPLSTPEHRRIAAKVLSLSRKGEAGSRSRPGTPGPSDGMRVLMGLER